MDSRHLRHIPTFICVVAGVIGAIVHGAVGVSAQRPATSSLEPNAIASVDRLYPGFIEILETCNAGLLPRLARILVANPSRESLDVLVGMLTDCPAWADGNGEVAVQLKNVARAAGTLPVERVSKVLLDGNADQRLAAAIFLNSSFDLLSSNERQDLEKTLISAVADPQLQVREWVASPLRTLDTPAGNAALARALESPDATDMFYFQASGRSRPRRVRQVDESTFGPRTVAAVNLLAPNFLTTLNSQDERAIVALRQTLERSSDLETTAVLVWILVNSRDEWYLPQVLPTEQRVSRLPLGNLGSLLATAEPLVRHNVAELLTRVLNLKNVPAPSLDELIRALMSQRQDPRVDVRVNVLTILAAAIKRRGAPFAGTPEVLRLLGELVGDRNLSSNDLGRVVEALGAIGNLSTLPLLERAARSTLVREAVREQAARAHIALSMPPDPRRELRRLVWETPDTVFEERVLREGRAALPLAWQALATGSAAEHRAAATLLAWHRDVGSVRLILAALDRSPGAVTGEQLLFALNMILLTEGLPADAAQANALAAAHLRWLYQQVANQRIDDDIRTTVLARDTIAVFPDRVTAPFVVDLSAEAPGTRQGQAGRQVRATAVRSSSPGVFLESVAKDQSGVAFHNITVAEGVARVATTLYLPGGRIANQVWISLYRNEGGQWVPLPVPPHPVLHRMLNEPNLLPAINRDYGYEYPLKVLRLDLTMERIRVDLKARDGLANENLDWWGTSTPVDASYVSLFERYRRSDALSVRHVAEYEVARLTGRPDVQFWLDTLAERPGTPFQTMALQVLGPYADRQLKNEGRRLDGIERNQLVAAAGSPQPVDRRLLPNPLPRPENIVGVQASARFARVEARFGSEPRGSSGYSMLFERRGQQWIFLFILGSWIS
jgi:hypothetical protein